MRKKMHKKSIIVPLFVKKITFYLWWEKINNKFAATYLQRIFLLLPKESKLSCANIHSHWEPTLSINQIWKIELAITECLLYPFSTIDILTAKVWRKGPSGLCLLLFAENSNKNAINTYYRLNISGLVF